MGRDATFDTRNSGCPDVSRPDGATGSPGRHHDPGCGTLQGHRLVGLRRPRHEVSQKPAGLFCQALGPRRRGLRGMPAPHAGRGADAVPVSRRRWPPVPPAVQTLRVTLRLSGPRPAFAAPTPAPAGGHARRECRRRSPPVSRGTPPQPSGRPAACPAHGRPSGLPPRRASAASRSAATQVIADPGDPQKIGKGDEVGGRNPVDGQAPPRDARAGEGAEGHAWRPPGNFRCMRRGGQDEAVVVGRAETVDQAVICHVIAAFVDGAHDFKRRKFAPNWQRTSTRPLT